MVPFGESPHFHDCKKKEERKEKAAAVSWLQQQVAAAGCVLLSHCAVMKRNSMQDCGANRERLWWII